MRLLHCYEETIVDGPGLRFAFYFAGCIHACPGCHNKASWNPKNGTELDDETLNMYIRQIQDNPYLDGITLSGGDPFYAPDELLQLLRVLKNNIDLPILVYTGYTIEQLYADDIMKECLYYIDMLVDGRFEREKRYPIKPFRGSWNQRFLVLEHGDVVQEL